MLKYSNTFSSPLSNSFFFPVDNMVLVSVDFFAHHPSQRSASVSSDRRQGLHGPDHRKGLFFRRLYFLEKLDTYYFLVTFTNLCRSSPLDKIIHLPHCWEPWQPLEVTKKIALEKGSDSVWKRYQLKPAQLQTVLDWQHIWGAGSKNFQRRLDWPEAYNQSVSFPPCRNGC